MAAVAVAASAPRGRRSAFPAAAAAPVKKGNHTLDMAGVLATQQLAQSKMRWLLRSASTIRGRWKCKVNP